MPRPQTIHEAAFRSSRPSTPGTAPPSRHSTYVSSVRSRAQLPRSNIPDDNPPSEEFLLDGEASPDVVDDPDGEQRRDGDGEWDDTSHEDRDSGNASGDDLDGDGRRLRDVQETINISHPFGLRIWKPALYRKFRSIDAKTYNALHATPGERPTSTLYLNPGNILWVVCFGWWISLVYLLVALVVLGPFALIGKVGATLLFGGKRRDSVKLGFTTCLKWLFLELESTWQYSKVLINLAGYVFWPFGKFIAKRRMYHMVFEQDVEAACGDHAHEGTALLADHDHGHHLHSNDTYVVGISDDYSLPTSPAIQLEVEEPTFAPHHDQHCDADTRSEGSEESWREYAGAERRYSYSSRDYHSQWPKWVPRWVRRSYNAGVAGTLFRIAVILTIAPLQYAIAFVCWFFIFPLPMAKLNYVLLKHLLRHPLQISAHTPVVPKARPSRSASLASRASGPWRRSLFWRPASILSESDEPVTIPATLGTPTAMPSGTVAQGPQLAPEFQVILCTYNAIGWEYYKYTYDGINIIIINLLAVVFFVIVDYYIIGRKFGYTGIASPNVIFGASLLSSIPLAYFIGMAVASITSETGSLAVGAVINATFGSIIEIILYMLALIEGKHKVVEGAVVGSWLAGLLALPGASMFFGGLRRKEQRFNAKAAGVTATMLIMAVIGCFTPTLFQEVYGTQELRCAACPETVGSHGKVTPLELALSCKGCRMVPTPPEEDIIYLKSTRRLVWISAALLIFMYAVGLWFTLRTHQKVIYEKPKKKRTRGGRVVERRSVLERIGLTKNTPVVPTPAADSAEKLTRVSSIAGSEKGSASTEAKGQRLSVAGNVSIGSAAGKRITRGIPPASGTDTPSEYPFPRLQVATDQHPTSPRLRPASQTTPVTPVSPSMPPMRRLETTTGVIHVADPDPIISIQPMSDWDTISQGSSDDSDVEEGGGHDHPNWGLVKSAIVLLACTVLYSIIAEVLISSVDNVVEKMGIGEKVLGVTLFSLVPLVTEFYNAIAFAMNNNIALSLEIGSAYVIQATMLQIPVIVAFSYFYFPISPNPLTTSPLSKLYAALTSPVAHPEAEGTGFTLIFPRWDLYAVLFGTFVLTYVYIEGKANYFKGAILVGAYVCLVGVYFYEPVVG